MSDSILADAIEKALKELGVPQMGYAAPVSNAIEILQKALETYKSGSSKQPKTKKG